MLPGFRDLDVVSHQSAIGNQKSQMVERERDYQTDLTSILTYRFINSLLVLTEARLEDVLAFTDIFRPAGVDLVVGANIAHTGSLFEPP